MSAGLRPWHLLQAWRALAGGGVIACPTEGVWGLSCDPYDPDAVARLLALKQRDPGKGLILVAATPEQLQSLVALDAIELARLAGPDTTVTTWVVPARAAAPAWITGGRDRVAVRVTRHPVMAALCRHWGGPLVSTSANPGGLPPARSALAVRKYFPQLDAIVHGALGGLRGPSRIVDWESGGILRA